MSNEKYTHVQELLPEIETMLAEGKNAERSGRALWLSG